MKKGIIVWFAALFLAVASAPTFAAMEIIGTAVYNNETPQDTSDDIACNLIWDDDNNGNSVIWLDYTHDQADWQEQMDWAAGLEAALTITLNPGISISWSDPVWRLPNTVDGQQECSCDGTATSATATCGYYFTNSEMGHLFYTELGNSGYQYSDGNSCIRNSPYGLQNTGLFDNLAADWYWSGTDHTSIPVFAWYFDFYNGNQDFNYKRYYLYGLALRSGLVFGGTIPTLSEWGQILLVVMLGASALWMKRRLTMRV